MCIVWITDKVSFFCNLINLSNFPFPEIFLYFMFLASFTQINCTYMYTHICVNFWGLRYMSLTHSIILVPQFLLIQLCSIILRHLACHIHSFFLRISLAIQYNLWYNLNFRNICSIFFKDSIGILTGIT